MVVQLRSLPTMIRNIWTIFATYRDSEDDSYRRSASTAHRTGRAEFLNDRTKQIEGRYQSRCDHCGIRYAVSSLESAIPHMEKHNIHRLGFEPNDLQACRDIVQ
jgi:hypothetical protein